MGTRILVSLSLIGMWFTFLAFLFFVFLAVTDNFSLFSGTSIVVWFVLNWAFFIQAQTLILQRAEKMWQVRWLHLFNVFNKLPFVLSCAATVYVITWPKQPKQL